MNEIKIIVDSASDILQNEAKELGVSVLPITVRFGEQEFADGVNLTHREFYEKLIESDKLPTTSQITPAVFGGIYEEITSKGDYVVLITMSSKLSGTYQSARIAAQDYEGKVFVVDSKTVCVGERILLALGMSLKEQGLPAKEIAQQLNEATRSLRTFALLDTLEYLKKGGRISSTVAFAGSLLSIKPVVSVDDGEVSLVGKARGSKHGENLLSSLIKKSGGIDFSKPYSVAYSGLSDALIKKYIADSSDLWPDKPEEIKITTVGCAIGTHVGPGAIAVSFFEKKQD